MKNPGSILAVALLLGAPMALAAGDFPLSVRVAPPDARRAPVIGLPTPDLAVVIRNDTGNHNAGGTPRALVLRGVEWVGGAGDPRRWHGPVVGSARENPDHSLTLNPNVARLTTQLFEHGLLLPGDEITVGVPLTPQGEESPLLKITYAWAGDPAPPTRGILLPVDQPGGTTSFVPATAELAESRHHRGGLGALQATLAAAAPPAAEQTLTVPVALALAPNPNYQLTGGISIIEAAWKAGADKARGPWHGVYLAPLRTWFFTAAGGRAVALERVPVAHPPIPPTAPPGFVPKPWKWTPRLLPAMDASAPEEFGRGEDGSTSILLDAPTFGPLLTVAERGPQRYAPSGETWVPADKFWAVLDLARAKGLRLRHSVVNPPAAEARWRLELSPPPE